MGSGNLLPNTTRDKPTQKQHLPLLPAPSLCLLQPASPA
jgi:hypothetical protein